MAFQKRVRQQLKDGTSSGWILKSSGEDNGRGMRASSTAGSWVPCDKVLRQRGDWQVVFSTSIAYGSDVIA
jgi:hypothetical protein